MPSDLLGSNVKLRTWRFGVPAAVGGLSLHSRNRIDSNTGTVSRLHNVEM